jgi:hypothetical protein
VRPTPIKTPPDESTSQGRYLKVIQTSSSVKEREKAFSDFYWGAIKSNIYWQKVAEKQQVAQEAKVAASKEFFTGIGYPQYGGKYSPFNVPLTYRVASITETPQGLSVTYKPTVLTYIVLSKTANMPGNPLHDIFAPTKTETVQPTGIEEVTTSGGKTTTRVVSFAESWNQLSDEAKAQLVIESVGSKLTMAEQQALIGTIRSQATQQQLRKQLGLPDILTVTLTKLSTEQIKAGRAGVATKGPAVIYDTGLTKEQIELAAAHGISVMGTGAAYSAESLFVVLPIAVGITLAAPELGISKALLAGGILSLGITTGAEYITTGNLPTGEQALTSFTTGELLTFGGLAVGKIAGTVWEAIPKFIKSGILPDLGIGEKLGEVGEKLGAKALVGISYLPSRAQELIAGVSYGLRYEVPGFIARTSLFSGYGATAGYITSGGNVQATEESALFGGAFSIGSELFQSVAVKVGPWVQERIGIGKVGMSDFVKEAWKVKAPQVMSPMEPMEFDVLAPQKVGMSDILGLPEEMTPAERWILRVQDVEGKQFFPEMKPLTQLRYGSSSGEPYFSAKPTESVEDVLDISDASLNDVAAKAWTVRAQKAILGVGQGELDAMLTAEGKYGSIERIPSSTSIFEGDVAAKKWAVRLQRGILDIGDLEVTAAVKAEGEYGSLVKLPKSTSMFDSDTASEKWAVATQKFELRKYSLGPILEAEGKYGSVERVSGVSDPVFGDDVAAKKWAIRLQKGILGVGSKELDVTLSAESKYGSIERVPEPEVITQKGFDYYAKSLKQLTSEPKIYSASEGKQQLVLLEKPSEIEKPVVKVVSSELPVFNLQAPKAWILVYQKSKDQAEKSKVTSMAVEIPKVKLVIPQKLVLVEEETFISDDISKQLIVAPLYIKAQIRSDLSVIQVSKTDPLMGSLSKLSQSLVSVQIPSTTLSPFQEEKVRQVQVFKVTPIQELKPMPFEDVFQVLSQPQETLLETKQKNPLIPTLLLRGSLSKKKSRKKRKGLWFEKENPIVPARVLVKRFVGGPRKYVPVPVRRISGRKVRKAKNVKSQVREFRVI